TLYAGLSFATTFAVVPFGVVLQTTNGGLSWSPVNSWFSFNTGLTSIILHSFPTRRSSDLTVYAGTTPSFDFVGGVFIGGGVFKSTNGGARWTAVNTGLTNVNVLALAIDPLVPSTVYVGTSFAGTSFSAVFRTTNAGTN